MIETTDPDLLFASEQGTAWLLQQVLDPYAPAHPPADPHRLITNYLDQVHDLLGITHEAVVKLADTVPRADGAGPATHENGLQLRWAASDALGDALVILIQQTRALQNTDGGLTAVDVEGAGLRVVVEGRGGKPFAVRGITSTLAHDVEVSPQEKVDLDFELSRALMDRVLASAGFAALDPRITGAPNVKFVLHRLEDATVSLNVPTMDGRPTLVEGRYYLGFIISLPTRSLRASLETPPIPVEFTVWQPWGQKATTNAIVLRQIRQITHAFADAAGDVFLHDPVTASGNVRIKPSTSSAMLDVSRTQVVLTRLRKPKPGVRWTLDGDRVRIVGGDPITAPGSTRAKPPSSLTPQFSFGTRTNHFAAVNAYYHCEAMLAKLDSLGLALAKFPFVTRSLIGPRLEVIPRAAIGPGPCRDGNCVNAQALLQTRGVGPEVLQLRFALADLDRNPGAPDHPVEPLGIATDVRVVWHEFCHAMIAAATGRLEFPFCHSAGDALAAIMGDPHSRLTWPKQEGENGERKPEWRYVTYPWGTTPGRRHDRSVGQGWSWSGPLGTDRSYSRDVRDMNGYAREQVLSSTLFRYYRAIGGDAAESDGRPNVTARQQAADYACYLIVGAIKSLGSVLTAPALNARRFLLALLAVDFARLTGPAPCPRRGGTTHKVMSWAFEEQGLPPLRMSHAGFPPDIFIANDVRHGSYEWRREWHSGPEGIWNRRAPDGKPGDQIPQLGQTNYIYVAVRNRYGEPPVAPPRPAQNVSVTVHMARTTPTTFPGKAWKSLGSSSPQSQATPNQELVFGPFPWVASSGTASFLAAAEAWGDRSNINPKAKHPVLAIPTRLDHLVPFDNNLGLRRIEL